MLASEGIVRRRWWWCLPLRKWLENGRNRLVDWIGLWVRMKADDGGRLCHVYIERNVWTSLESWQVDSSVSICHRFLLRFAAHPQIHLTMAPAETAKWPQHARKLSNRRSDYRGRGYRMRRIPATCRCQDGFFSIRGPFGRVFKDETSELDSMVQGWELKRWNDKASNWIKVSDCVVSALSLALCFLGICRGSSHSSLDETDHVATDRWTLRHWPGICLSVSALTRDSRARRLELKPPQWLRKSKCVNQGSWCRVIVNFFNWFQRWRPMTVTYLRKQYSSTELYNWFNKLSSIWVLSCVVL